MRNTYLSTRFDYLNSKEENVGIFLDIFPLDIAPEDGVLQQKHIKKLGRIKLRKNWRRGYLYSDAPLKKVIKKTIAALMCFYNFDELNEEFDKACRLYENTESSLWCSMSSRFSYSKQCMPASVYGKPQLVKFEDRMYYAPEQLDEYLTRICYKSKHPAHKSERDVVLAAFYKKWRNKCGDHGFGRGKYSGIFNADVVKKVNF